MAEKLRLMGKELPVDARAMLGHKVMSRLLYQHAQGESNEENIDFIRAAAIARSPEALRSLYETFLAPRAPQSVNLSSERFDDFRNVLVPAGNFNISDWAPALQKCVSNCLQLLDHDVLPRFFLSESYKTLILTIAKPDEVARKVGIEDATAKRAVKELILLAGQPSNGAAAQMKRMAHDLWAKGHIDYKHPDALLNGLRTGRFEAPANGNVPDGFFEDGIEDQLMDGRGRLTLQKKHFQLMGIPKFKNAKSKERLEDALNAYRAEDEAGAKKAYALLQKGETYFQDLTFKEAIRFFIKFKLLK